MNTFLSIALSTVFRIFKTVLSSAFWDRVVDLVDRAEKNLVEVPGPDKKEWVINELKEFYQGEIKENIREWPSFVLSMVVDVIVAKYKLS